MNKELVKSFLRHLLGAALTALAAVQWTAADYTWKVLAFTVGAACVPVVVKALDPSEPGYGVNKDESGHYDLPGLLVIAAVCILILTAAVLLGILQH